MSNLPDGMHVDDLPGQGDEICEWCETNFNPDETVDCPICDDVLCSVECLESHREENHQPEEA